MSDDPYKEYRREYKANWYQVNKHKVNTEEASFRAWIRRNPQYKNTEDIKDLYLKHGATETKRIVLNRLTN